MSKNGYDRFLDYQFGYSGDFFKLLFKTMFQADSSNLAKLSLGFTEEAAAVKLFKEHHNGKEVILDCCTPGYALVKDVREGKRTLLKNAKMMDFLSDIQQRTLVSQNGYDRFLDYQFRRSGDFFKSLFKALFQADSTNFKKLALGFPEEAGAVLLFTQDPNGKTLILNNCLPGNCLVEDIREGRRLL